jgi:hypothetical protein
MAGHRARAWNGRANVFRNVVLAVTAVLLLMGALCLVLCLHQYDDVPFAHIDLPVVDCAPFLHGGLGLPKFIAELDSRGILSIHGTPLTDRQFRGIVAERYKTYGEFPFCVAADRHLSFSDVWCVVEIGQAHGQWRQSFVANDVDLVALRKLRFHVPLPDFWPLSTNVILELDGNAVSINGRETTLSDLEPHLTRLGEFSHSMSISLAASAGTPYSTVVDVLAACHRAGLRMVQIAGIVPGCLNGPQHLLHSTTEPSSDTL